MGARGASGFTLVEIVLGALTLAVEITANLGAYLGQQIWSQWMQNSREARFIRGFTLVEIMIVVAIIALLAAIAIPNVLRGRATANETACIGNVRALISSLEMYRSVYQQYVDTAGNWTARMAGGVGTPIVPAYCPPSFCQLAMDGTTANARVQGFKYLYTPGGQTYTIRAVPDVQGSTGTRTFFGDQSGQVFHCSGIGTSTGTQGATIDLLPPACT